MVSVVLGVVLPLVFIVLFIASMAFRMDVKKQYDAGERSGRFSWSSLGLMVAAVASLLLTLVVWGVPVIEKTPLWMIPIGAVLVAAVFELAYKLFVSTVKWSDELPRLYE